MRVTFSCLAKRKSPKRKRPHCLRPLRFATGQPAVLGFGGVSLNSRRCASLRHTRALIRQTLRSSAHPEGHRGTEQPHGPLLRSAPSRGCKRHALRSLGRAQQWPVGPFGCSAVPPLLAAPAAGRLWGEHGRRSAHASCSDSPWMSERRAAAQSEFHGAPRNRPDAGVPRSEAQGSQTGGRLSFGYFSLAKQRTSTSPAGASPGSRPEHWHAVATESPGFSKRRPNAPGKTQ